MSIAALLIDVLERLGYTVILAELGLRRLLFSSHQSRIALVILIW